MRLLRGRVLIREDHGAEFRHYKNILIPTQDDRARTTHRGTVLQVGEPARTKHGHEVPHGFNVGDEVLFSWQHHEKTWTFDLDGEKVCAVSQECVYAVVDA